MEEKQLSEEEKKQIDDIAESLADEIFKPKKRKRKAATVNKDLDQAVNKMIEGLKEIAPAQIVVPGNMTEEQVEEFKEAALNEPLQVMPQFPVPEAVREALEKELDNLDEAIKSCQRDIEERNHKVGRLSHKYKVIAEFLMKGN